MKMESAKLLTVYEAEQLLGRKATTLRRDIRLRKIACVRIGRQVRIPIEAVREMIRKGYQDAVS
jgi:excisionase family DNA binding protein